MPSLIIDDLEIEVPQGTKVIEAAERLGIMIPRFCYHHALGSAGACRMCAVKFLQGPFKGVQMSCMIEAQDGMVVSTTDEEAVSFRKQVIEWLMLNHPHDCPVCDEGGQCLLQDETASSGHGIRRYAGRKRTYRDQYLGAFIAHEMNRCIHCTRCVRFYQDYTGYRDLGTMGIASHVYFGRYGDGPLESPFAGNLVELCPTGVYTDKPSRHKVRHWDLERSPSVCIHCSLGCNTVAAARYREIMRVEPRFNEAVNGYFICDRGRYGLAYANHVERPRGAVVDGVETDCETAVRAASERLSAICAEAGSDAAAVLGSARNSLETQVRLERLVKRKGWRAPRYFVDPGLAHRVERAVAGLSERTAVSLREIETADVILAVGVNPVNEAPMLALAMRQARRREASVTVVDPRPVSLPFAFEHIAMHPDDIDGFLDALTGLVRDPAQKPVSGAGAAGKGDSIAVPAGKLAGAGFPVIVCGTAVTRETTPDRAAGLADAILERGSRAGLFYVLPGANAFGAALWAPARQRSFSQTLEGIENGAIKGLLAIEADPLREFPDRPRLERALKKLELLVAVDCLPSETLRSAHIVIPTSTLFESGGSYVNQEGRVQYAEPVYKGGVPIGQAGGGSHPRRAYGVGVPGADPRSAPLILAALEGDADASPADRSRPHVPFREIADECPALAVIGQSYPVDGIRVLPARALAENPTAQVARHETARRDDVLELILADTTFGSEELSHYSHITQQVEPRPHAVMHAADAAAAGLSDGDRIRLNLAGGPVEINLMISTAVAQGVLIVPRHRDVDWRGIGSFRATIPLSAVEKA